MGDPSVALYRLPAEGVARERGRTYDANDHGGLLRCGDDVDFAYRLRERGRLVCVVRCLHLQLRLSDAGAVSRHHFRRQCRLLLAEPRQRVWRIARPLENVPRPVKPRGEPALNRTTSENPDETVFTLAKREDHSSSRPPVDPLVTPWFRGRGRPDPRNDNPWPVN